MRFIRDNAVTEDDFGGHERTADLLVELIDHQDRPRLIGLLGSWGSGKSTVLGIARKKLIRKSPTSPPVVFTFDAWMHQSDPPRRAFIEALVAFLVQEHLGLPETWKDELDAVQKRVETHDITNTPFLSGWAVAIAFALLLLPLGVRLSTEDGWMWLGWAIVAAPFSIAVVNWWAWRRHRWFFPTRTFFTKANFTTNRRPYRNRSVASIFVNKSTDKTVNTILKTPEPTSIEFRKTFCDVLSKLQLPNNKVVFVLDNLDRISPDDAFTIWSTFRSLFASPEDIIAKCGIDFHVVIPIDYNSLKRVYSKGLESNPTESEGVQSLIEKSFDIVLRVPPPVQSGWIEYVRDKIRYVANGLSETQIHNASSIFASALEHGGISAKVTPRQINNFANRVAGELMVADKSVSPEAVFYYSAFARISSAYDIQEIVSIDAPGAGIIGRVDREWRAGVAALHFGVDKDRALQLLIGDDVVEAVLAENDIRLAELAQLPGFDLVLTNILRTDVGRGPYFYGALAGLIPEHFAAGVAGQAIWTLLEETLPLDGGWDKLSTTTVKGLGRLGTRGDDLLRGNLAASLSTADQTFTPEPRLWLSHVQALLTATGADRASVLSRLAVPSGPGFYVAVMRELAADDLPQDARKVLRPRADSAAIIAEVVTTLASDEYSSASLRIVANMLVVDFRWDWSSLIEATRDAVANAEEIELASDAVRLLLSLPDPEDAISYLGSQGHLPDLFKAAWGEEETDKLSVLIEAISIGWASLQVAGQTGESAEGVRILKNLDAEAEAERDDFTAAARLAISRRSPTVVRGLLTWANDHPAAKDTILAAIERAFAENEVGRLHVVDAIPHLVAIAKADGPVGKGVVRHISRYTTFWAELSKRPPDDIALILNVVAKSSISAQEATTIQGAFEGLDEAYWRDVISNKRWVLQALDGLLAVHPGLRLSPALAKARDAYIDDVIGGGISLVLMNVSWRRLLAASEPTALERSIQQALDLAETGDLETKEKILRSLDDGLLLSGQAKKEAIRIITHVVLPILRGGVASAVELLVQRAAALAPVVKRARGRNREELIARIDALTTSEALSGSSASALKNSWSLKPKKREAA